MLAREDVWLSGSRLECQAHLSEGDGDSVMGKKTLIIRSLKRMPASDTEDELLFRPGVNVIAGQPNTGKTKWLKMLDYLMGDPGSPEDSLGADLADKYDSVEAVVQIGDEEITTFPRIKW